MTPTQPRASSARLLGAASAALLAVTVALALGGHDPFGALAVLVAGVGWAVVMLRSRAREAALVPAIGDHARPRRRSLRPSAELIAYLSPVLLLSVAYPIATARLTRDSVGGAHLTTLLLAASVTVPWLTQSVCLPLYRAVAPQLDAGDADAVRARLCEVWPSTFLRSLPVVAAFTLAVELSTGWSLPAIGVYVGLCVLYVAFSQSLVLSILDRRRLLWAAGWAAFAACLLAAPALWFLPPIAGVATQLLPLRRHLARLLRPVRLERADVAVDLVRGLILGAVLWADKLLLFVRSGGHFAVTTVFIALLPAILVYNYYFVRLAPRFDAMVLELREGMESEPYSELATRSSDLSSYVERSLGVTAVAGAALVLAVTAAMELVDYRTVPLVAAVAIASWMFMMVTLACYKLDYIGRSRLALGYSAVHLAACAVGFSVLPVGPSLYAFLALTEAALLLVALRSVSGHWQSSEYNLFWRHATAW